MCEVRPRDASEAEGRCKVRSGFVVGALRGAWLRWLERSGARGFGGWSAQGRLASVVGALRRGWLRWPRTLQDEAEEGAR